MSRRLGMVGMVLVACREKPPCVSCDTAVIAATGEPSALLPPLVGETVGRDISDQVFERLADLKPGKAPLDSMGYEPRLAKSWERVDSLTLRFHLRPGARWHDGRLVTANDVVFSFDAYADSTLETAAGEQIRGSLHAEAPDSSTVLVRFSRSYPEQLLDATWHVRIIPAHIWAEIQRSEWINDSSLAHLVGSGPYRIARWEHGQSLTLEADSTQTPMPAIRRLVWRFAPDPDAALNAVLSHEADLMETVGSPDRVARVAGDTSLSAVRYPSAAYGFVGYRVSAARQQVGKFLKTGPCGARSTWRPIEVLSPRRSSVRTARPRRGRCPNCSGSGTTESGRFPSTPPPRDGSSTRQGGCVAPTGVAARRGGL